MQKLPAPRFPRLSYTYERYTFDECPLVQEKDAIVVAVEKQSRYQRRISEMMAQEQREVEARLAAFQKAKPAPASPGEKGKEPIFAPEHKLIFFPLTHNKKGQPFADNNGGPFIRLIPIGYRIILDASGGWWFYSLKAGSWTKHMPPTINRYRSLTPVMDSKGEVEMVEGGTLNYRNLADLAKRLKHCPRAVITLITQREACDKKLADKLEKAGGSGSIKVYLTDKKEE